MHNERSANDKNAVTRLQSILSRHDNESELFDTVSGLSVTRKQHTERFDQEP